MQPKLIVEPETGRLASLPPAENLAGRPFGQSGKLLGELLSPVAVLGTLPQCLLGEGGRDETSAPIGVFGGLLVLEWRQPPAGQSDVRNVGVLAVKIDAGLSGHPSHSLRSVG